VRDYCWSALQPFPLVIADDSPHLAIFTIFLRVADISDVKEELFEVLDRDGSSRISEDEFMAFGSVLTLEFVKVSNKE